MPPRKRVSSSRSPAKSSARAPPSQAAPPAPPSPECTSSPDPLDVISRPSSPVPVAGPSRKRERERESVSPTATAPLSSKSKSQPQTRSVSPRKSVGASSRTSSPKKRKPVSQLEGEESGEEWQIFKNQEKLSTSPAFHTKTNIDQHPARAHQPFQLSPTRHRSVGLDMSKSPGPAESMAADGAKSTLPTCLDVSDDAEPVESVGGTGDEQMHVETDAPAGDKTADETAGANEEPQSDVDHDDGESGVPAGDEMMAKVGATDAQEKVEDDDDPPALPKPSHAAEEGLLSQEEEKMDTKPPSSPPQEEAALARISAPEVGNEAATADANDVSAPGGHAKPQEFIAPKEGPVAIEPKPEAAQAEQEADQAVATSEIPDPATSPARTGEEGEEEIEEEVAPPSEGDNGEERDVDTEDASAAAGATPPVSTTPSEPDVKPKSGSKKKAPASQAKSKAKQAVTHAAKKATKSSKSKGKVDILKGSKTPASRATPDSTSVSVASHEARGASPESETDLIYCICRKRESEDDDDVLMVGCESCEEWFHASCIGLTKDQVDNLDVYICRSCERSTKQKTIYQQSCKREGCHKGLAGRDSKFCSDVCAYKHMKAFTDSITVKKTLKQLSTTFAAYPKPPSVQIIHHADVTVPGTGTEVANPAQQLLSVVQSQMAAMTAALELVRRRQQILQQAIDHAESLAPVVIAQEDIRGSKNKRKSGTGPTEDKQCAWDPRLIWTDDQVKTWSADGQDGGEGICELAKKRCDRHSGWQKTIAISLEVEERQLDQQQSALVEQYDGLTKSAEATKESEQQRTAFKEKLAAKRRA